MSTDPGAPLKAAGLRLQGAATALPGAMRVELDRLADRVAAVMRQEAPKHLTTLTNSVRVENETTHTRLVHPTVDYAGWVETGRRPGKGLPRFFDPAAASAVAWLQARMGDAARTANPKYRKARPGTARFTAEELDLRDRYWAWSRAVKQRGIKPNAFVGRTLAKVQPLVAAALAGRAVATLERSTRTGGAA